MSTLSRQYYKEVMQFVTSKEFKSLPQQAQNKIKQVAKETHSKLREAEDARQPVDERETRKARGVLTNALTDLYSGMASVGKSGASLAAWTADIAGAKDTAKTLDEAALSLGNVAERITPAADPESWVDFGAQSVAQNAPVLASAIIGGKALAGSKVLGGLVGAGRTALGVPGLPAAASGLSPSAASFASTLGAYGIPGARQANVEADYELTGKLREGKPFAEVMMAVPYAWVENTMGIGASKFMGNAAATNTITSMLQKNASKVSKALSKPLFELSNKSGVRGAVGAFARWIADNVVGEAGEEVIQGIMEEAMPFFTDLPVEQAIAKSLERINSPEVAEKLALQAKGGGIVGAVLGGGRTAVQSAVTAREAKLAERADAAAKIVADKAYSIMHESKDYASMITGLKKLHAQTEDQSHKDRITALIAMAHRKFSQQAQAELVMPPQEAQPNPIVESVVSGTGDVIAGQRDRLTGLSARLDNALANKYSPQEDSGVSPEIAPAVEQTAQGELLPEGKTVKDERLKLWMLKARTQSAIRKLQAINPSAPKAQTMDDAKEIDYNRASAIFEYALNPADEQSGREAIEAFREYPIELQEMIKSDYEQAQPEAGKRLSVIPGTWKAKKEAAKQAELEAKQAKTAAKKARLAEQKRIANERAKAEAAYPAKSAKLQPNAAGVQIVDKSGQVPSTKRLVAAGDASRIEKKLTQEKPYVKSEPKSNMSAPQDVTNEPSYNRTLKNIEILRKEGVQPYINITRRIDNRNVVYEAYTPEGKLLASSKKHSGSGSVEYKLLKRKDRYFSASIGSVEINKDDVFSMALFQQKQQEIDRQIQTYNGEAEQKAADLNSGKSEPEINISEQKNVTLPAESKTTESADQEALQMINDMVAERKRRGQSIPEQWLEKRAAIQAKLSGTVVDEGEIPGAQVFGHPQATNVGGGRYDNLVPIVTKSAAGLERRMYDTQKFIDELQSKIATAEAISKKKMTGPKAGAAATHLKKLTSAKAATAYLNSQEFVDDQTILELLKTETMPELDRMHKALLKNQPTVKQPEPAAEQKPTESVKQPATISPEPAPEAAQAEVKRPGTNQDLLTQKNRLEKEIKDARVSIKTGAEWGMTPGEKQRLELAIDRASAALIGANERLSEATEVTQEKPAKEREQNPDARIKRFTAKLPDGSTVTGTTIYRAEWGGKNDQTGKPFARVIHNETGMIASVHEGPKGLDEANRQAEAMNIDAAIRSGAKKTPPTPPPVALPLKPALEVFKGDDITFQFPDGRTEGAYVQDATPKTIDGIADQIYVKLDANGALRYLPKSWITKVKPSLMRQNKMDLAATEAKREADTAKPEAWHTKLPETGKKTTGSTAEIINATSDDAFSALTADQKRAIMVGQDKFNLYVLPATDGNAGVIRFIPEDQKPANGWVQIPEFKETYRLGKMTEAQQKDLLTRAAWRAPILPAERTRSSTAEKTKPEKAPAPKPAGKIEDFGEVLHGARKLYSQEFADSFKSSGDLATQPLSKSWPEPDYQKLIDAGMNTADVSLLRALRDTLPVKPRNAWRVKSWLEIAKKHKTLAEKIVSGKMESKDFHQDGPLSEFLEIKNLMSLYEAVGHSASLAGAKIRYGTYFYQNGVKLDTPVDGYEVLMPGKNSWGGIGVGFGKTMTEAIADFKKKLPAFLSQKGATAKQRTTQFSVYQKMRGEGVGTYFIAYKTGGKLVELKKGFATGKEAQDYRNANRAELEAILKGKRDVKPERRATNQPRVGKTRRTGDVTPQQFTDTFGFRGVQFGNWVEGDRRQVDLNEAYDALSDLADVLGIPARALSLNGELGLAFGSRGKGGKNPAAAHYEPGMVVINLTKKKGAGSLAHEWWHALDNYFGKGTVRGMATESAAEYHDSRLIRGREEIKNAFWNLGKTIKNSTNMKKRGEIRDETRSKPYWSTDVEISARSFESFILSKLSDAQINNDYLANIVSEESYTASAEENDYPYLLKSEIPSVKDAFNALFQTMQSEKTDKGIKLYSVEHLVAKYAAQGLKQAAKIVRAGWDLFKSGVTKFADWAKGMLKQFGSRIGKQLRSMYADLQSFNKQLGRAGAVGSRGLKGKFKAPVVPAPVKVKAQKPAGVPKSFGVQSKDLKWVKDNPSRLRLVNDGKAVAALERNEKKQWLWKGTNRAFLNLGRAKSVVKQELFKLLKDGERQTARYKKAEMKANEQAEARKRKHDDYFSRPLKDNFDNPETKLTAAEKWQNFLHKVDETQFDRWAREKRLIAGAVSKKGLARIPESENFYQRHELLANRIAARTEDFKESQYQPIENYLVENNISYKAFNRFLRVMHAEERNNHVFQINPEFRQRAMEDPDNPMYAGSGITTKAAREEIARMKADGTFETFNKAGKMFWDLNNKLLDIQVKYGILPADVRDVLKNKYKYYAPLKSMDEDSRYLDWRALGRRSESSDQLAHTVKAIESTFSYGENTRLRRAFAKFAINNPNPALYEIRRAVKKPYFDEDSGEVKYRLDMEGDRKDILYVKNGGNDLVFIIKDPDLLASLTNKNAAEVGGIGRGLLFVNRWLGAVNTAFAPEFMIANLIRDVQTAGISLSAEQSSDMAAKVLLNIPKAITAVAQYKMGERNADGALYKEFLMQGGKIGYRDVYNLQETAKDLEKKIAEAQKGGAWFQSKTLLKDLGSFISDCNDVIESGTRLSTYMVARKAGMSKQAAAALAAGVTINFQKKGTWGQAINALYLFGSASLGGTARVASVISKASQTKTGRAIIAGTVAYGFVADIINRILGGIDPDDERSYYDKINAAEKDMNYILMIPGTKGKHLKLPMPHGFSALPAMGRNLSAMMFGDQTLMQSVGNVANTLASSFSPTGYDERGLGHTVMPTALGLPVDLMTNSKFTGNRIKPEQNPFGAKLPQSQLVNKNTNKLLVVLTQALNRIAGGDERTPSGIPGTDISAADLQHVIESLTGGAGKIVSRSVDLLWRVGAAEEIPVGNVPFVRRLIGEAGDYSVYDSFMDRRDRVKRFEDARRKEDAAWVSDNRWLEVALRRYRAAEKTAKDIRNDSTLSDSDKRERVVLEQKRFNRDFDKIKAQYDKPGATIPVEPETKKNSRPGRPRPPKRPKRPRLPKLSRL